MAAALDERRGRSPASGSGARAAAPARSARDTVRARKLLRAARRGDRGARERLVVKHLALVRGIARRYDSLGLPFDDLVQEGAVGLLEAIDHYDPARGVAFESYARFRVRRAVRNALTDQARLIRLPKQIVERRRAVDHAEEALTASAGGRAPTLAQIASATGLSRAAVREARSAGRAPISLDAPVSEDGAPLESLVADRGAGDPEAELLAQERAELLAAALARLPERQRRVLRRRWGLGGRGQSHAELAAELGVSRRRAQTIERDALRELRAAFESAPEPAFGAS